jgi:hypothetical protein
MDLTCDSINHIFTKFKTHFNIILPFTALYISQIEFFPTKILYAVASAMTNAYSTPLYQSLFNDLNDSVTNRHKETVH